ncbi:hypothetical protein HY441_00095 [Candidatus Microgenomates bacterium]|nr:hypothetical protein [Candidatus Microgenomates bacterium]
MKLLPSWLKNFFIHWLPNAVLVAGVVVLIQANLELLAAALILVSKWQILRGGRKLWLRNLRDNACDLVVAASSLTLLMLLVNDLVVQLVVAGLYLLWLIAIKPLTGHVGVAVQAAVCQFVGLTVLFLLGRTLPQAAVIGLAWLVALVAADHLLAAHHERAHAILMLGWALIVAQASWLFWHWLIVYSFWHNRLLLPQAPIVISLAGYIFGNMYLDHSQSKLRKSRLVEYVVLFFGLAAAIIIGTQWDTRL